jgi:hypothetical protein
MTFNPLTTARDRAFQIAATGECKNWPEIAWQLVSEGYGGGAVIAVGSDQLTRDALSEALVRALGPHAAA